MIKIEPKHSFMYDGVNCLVYHANKGEGLPLHEHTFSHGTICHIGSIVIRKDNKETIVTPEEGGFNLLAGAPHEIEALEDGTIFVNIFAEGKSY